MDDPVRKNSRRAVRVALPGLLIFVICLGIVVPMLSVGAGNDNQSSLDDNRSHRSNV
jgi:hypothetical protein